MHKRIGILGGTSPESTIKYYSYITREYVRRFGDYAYPEILIYSVSFQTLVDLQRENRYDLVVENLSAGLNALCDAGADFGLIAAVTLHRVFEEVAAMVKLPLINIIDATRDIVIKNGHRTVGLLGTNTTMTENFFKKRLGNAGIEVLIPGIDSRVIMDRIIFTEVARGVIKSDSAQQFLEVIRTLEKRGAEAIILGCTEIPLLVDSSDCNIPTYNSTEIHANAALEQAIS